MKSQTKKKTLKHFHEVLKNLTGFQKNSKVYNDLSEKITKLEKLLEKNINTDSVDQLLLDIDHIISKKAHLLKNNIEENLPNIK